MRFCVRVVPRDNNVCRASSMLLASRRTDVGPRGFTPVAPSDSGFRGARPPDGGQPRTVPQSGTDARVKIVYFILAHLLLFVAYAWAGDADSDGFYVNTCLQVDHPSPAVSIGAAGNFVMAWQRKGQDGTVYTLTEEYNASGAKVSSELTWADHPATPPALNLDSPDNFAVVRTTRFKDGSYDVFARQHDSVGTAVGPEIKVRGSGEEDMPPPSVTLDPSGNVVVVW